MIALAAVHRLRGIEGRAAFEFDCLIDGVPLTLCWHPKCGWCPQDILGRPQPLALIAERLGVSEASAPITLSEAAVICEQEYLRHARPALHLAA